MTAASHRSLSFQTLENRLPFAGDLNVQFNNGDLFITGDGDAESVIVEEVGFAFTGARPFLKVTGVNGTTIEGQPSRGFVTNNQLRNITINLNGGEDEVQIRNLDNDIASGNLVVKLGGGDDVLTMENVNIKGNIDIQAENNDDLVILNEVAAGALLKVDLGFGDDELDVLTATADDLTVIGSFGNDSVKLVDVTVVDQLFADLGDGDDVLELQRVKATRFDLNGNDDNDLLILHLGAGRLDALKAANGSRNFETIDFRF